MLFISAWQVLTAEWTAVHVRTNSGTATQLKRNIIGFDQEIGNCANWQLYLVICRDAAFAICLKGMRNPNPWWSVQLFGGLFLLFLCVFMYLFIDMYDLFESDAQIWGLVVF